MKNLSCRTFALVLYIGCMYSCKKGDTDTFVPPVDTLEVLPLAPPPSSISFEPADLQGSFTLSFDYTSVSNKISIYLDDTTTADPYDKLAIAYSFNNGYLEKTEYYTSDGIPAGGFTIHRSGSTITGVTTEHLNENEGGLITNDLLVSFADSMGLTNMYVNYGNSFDPQVPVSIKYTFKGQQLKETKAGLFSSGANSVFFPSYKFNYKSNGCLWVKESDSYYGTSFIYGDAGKGLDSLFKVLGGRDEHLIEAILYYDEYIGLFFRPLQILLSDNSVELDALVHRYGALQEVKSLPNGNEYPTLQTFTFQNSFDEEKRLVKSRVVSNSLLYAVYTVKY